MQLKLAVIALFTSMVLATPSLEKESEIEKRCFDKWGDCSEHSDCCGDLQCVLHLTGEYKGPWCDKL
ncbi:hypothetical protein DIS24_g1759 [Lasiodiplodia hormozganensis]|uniref:Uncharacterized protein n=1 Tax=Lasiodiplodia hormozganensis TaxID=869390 RepID=A0AA39Z1X0_9PEZI|nr:hypothetical protein DIS24_g1759 [Lasiodiplodia hormozganensis]